MQQITKKLLIILCAVIVPTNVALGQQQCLFSQETNMAEAAYDFEGNSNDVSGAPVHNSQPGSVQPAYSTNTPTGSGQSADFNGTSHVLQYSDGTFMNQPFTNLTVQFWINPDDLVGTQHLYDEGGSTHGIAIRLQGSTLRAAVRDSSTQVTLNHQTAVVANQWQLVTMTYENGEFKLYLDGVEDTDPDGTTGFGGIPNHANASGLGAVMGGSSAFGNTGSNFFNGQIDAFRYYRSVADTCDWGDLPRNLTCVDAYLNDRYPAASHSLSGIMLGASRDADLFTSQPSSGCPGTGSPGAIPDADGDGADDDGVVFSTIMGTSFFEVAQDNMISVTASGNGFLNVWLDINRDGDFNDAGEQFLSDQALVGGVNPITIPAASLPTTLPDGETYMRFRACDAAASCNLPSGNASSGEVEDYRVHIVKPNPFNIATNSCTATLTTNTGFETPNVASNGQFNEIVVSGWAFNSLSPSSVRGTTVPTSLAGFVERNLIEIWDNAHTIGGTGSTPGGVFPNAFEGQQMAEINSSVSGNLYQDLILPAGTSLTWRFAHRGRQGLDRMAVKIGPTGSTVVQATVASQGPSGDSTDGVTDCTLTLGGSSSSTDVSTEETGTAPTGDFWCVYQGTYVTPLTGDQIIRFEYESVSTSTGNTSVGNLIDSISLDIQSDISDAPTTISGMPAYPSACHGDNKAFGGSTSLTIGNTIDFERNDSIGSANADGDDSDGTDDEDGVIFSISSVGSVANLNASMSVRNDTGANAFACAWLDQWDNTGNGDNDFSSAGDGKTCVSVPDNGGVASSVSFDWSGLPAVNGSTYARFRVCNILTQCNQPGSIATKGEVEDYLIPFNPTAVTIGSVNVNLVDVDSVLSSLDQRSVNGDSLQSRLLQELAPDSPVLDSDTTSQAETERKLKEHLDPDGDGKVATLVWDTLEERGTIGFYAERFDTQTQNWKRLNKSLLPGLVVAPMGGEYLLFDPTVQESNEYKYRLLELEADGEINTYGPFNISVE